MDPPKKNEKNKWARKKKPSAGDADAIYSLFLILVSIFTLQTLRSDDDVESFGNPLI